MPEAVASGGQRLFFVVCKDLPGIIIYDADTHEQIAQAITPGTINPHEAAFSLDGSCVYVPIYGTSGVGKPGQHGHTLHIFRTSDGKGIASLDTSRYLRPHCVAVGQQSGLVYASTELAESLIVIDPAQPAMVGAIPTGSNTSHMFAVTRDEQKAYVSNVRSKDVSVLNVQERKLEKIIPTEGENQRMTLSPDERWFVTSLGPAQKIAFFRTSDNELDFTIPIDGTPFVAKFSADGRLLYNAGFASPKQLAAWKIDVAARYGCCGDRGRHRRGSRLARSQSVHRRRIHQRSTFQHDPSNRSGHVEGDAHHRNREDTGRNGLCDLVVASGDYVSTEKRKP